MEKINLTVSEAKATRIENNIVGSGKLSFEYNEKNHTVEIRSAIFNRFGLSLIFDTTTADYHTFKRLKDIGMFQNYDNCINEIKRAMFDLQEKIDAENLIRYEKKADSINGIVGEMVKELCHNSYVKMTYKKYNQRFEMIINNDDDVTIEFDYRRRRYTKIDSVIKRINKIKMEIENKEKQRLAKIEETNNLKNVCINLGMNNIAEEVDYRHNFNSTATLKEDYISGNINDIEVNLYKNKVIVKNNDMDKLKRVMELLKTI